MRAAMVFLVVVSLGSYAAASEVILSAEELIQAVNGGEDGATIEVGPGTFRINVPLEPKSEMTIKGAGMGKTVITHVADWRPSTKTLPDPETKLKGMDTRACSCDERTRRTESPFPT